MIDVIIPAYNAHKTIKNTLYSLCYQSISNKLNVIIVNDKSDNDYSEIVNYFSKYIKVKEIILNKNSGPGYAREIGINNSNNKYIMFMDSDDTLASPKAVEILYKNIKNKKLDLCIGKFIENRNGTFINHINDEIWLHGKMYKRSFLEENNIHFNNTRSNEDNYFNQCIMLSKPKKEYIDEPIYFWMYNENSITRKNNNEYHKKGIIGYIDNMTSVIEYGINNKKSEILLAYKIVGVMYAIYYYYIEFKEKDYLVHTKKLKKYYDKYEKICRNKDIVKNTQYEFALNNLTKDKILNNKLKFEDFLKKIEV